MTSAKVAREYLRVSDDKTGRGKSVADQHTENEQAAEEQGWRLGTPYREPEAVSASRYSRKTRELFNRLLDDIDSGRFGADILILWEGSRGSRRTGEWVRLADVCAERGVSIHVTSHHRTYDPAIGRDRKTLLEDAVNGEYETAELSARVTRALAANAKDGLPHGRIPYGYRRVYDERTKLLVRQEPDPDTAENVRELFRRVREGDSLRSIERDWRERGIVNRSGRPFGSAHLRSLLDVRTYVGDRMHNGVKHQGTWEPLVDRETWQAVRAILEADGRTTRRPGRGKYAVSMLARCGVCEGPLVGDTKVDGKHRTEPVYRCRNNHVTISMPDLDAYMLAVVSAYLSRPDVHAGLTAAATDSATLQVARNKVAEIQGELDDLYAKGAEGALSPAAVAAIEPGTLDRLRAAQHDLDALQTPAALSGIVDTAEGASEALARLTTEQLRAVYGYVCTPEVLGVPHINRSARTGPNQPDVHERIEWRKPEKTTP